MGLREGWRARRALGGRWWTRTARVGEGCPRRSNRGGAQPDRGGRARWAAAGRAWPAALAAALLVSGCGRGAATAPAPAVAAPAGGKVAVLYAGSLVNLMEHQIGPAFDRASGDHFQGYAGGSVALAHQIRGHLIRADVFISAVPSVNASLMGTAHGDWVRWYASFAAAPLVIGYNPKSRFAAALKTQPWYRVLGEPGFRLGRTDPKLDPKGALTIQLVQRAAALYHRPQLVRQLLGAAENPAQVFPEQNLVGRLQAGQLDAGFFYANEAVQAHIPFVSLPPALRLSALYTLTVVRGAPDPAGAAAFARYLLGPAARAFFRQDGLQVVPPKVVGQAAAVPAGLRPLLGAG